MPKMIALICVGEPLWFIGWHVLALNTADVDL